MQSYTEIPPEIYVAAAIADEEEEADDYCILSLLLTTTHCLMTSLLGGYDIAILPAVMQPHVSCTKISNVALVYTVPLPSPIIFSRTSRITHSEIQVNSFIAIKLCKKCSKLNYKHRPRISFYSTYYMHPVIVSVSMYRLYSLLILQYSNRRAQEWSHSREL